MIRGASAAKSAPPWQDLRAMHSRKAVCGAFRIHGAHILPKPARFGYMAAICCQGGALFPSEAPSGMHGARKLPRQGVRGRIAREYCRRQSLENAFREDLAMDECPDSPRGKQRPSSRKTTPKAGSGECPTTKTKEGERFARLLSLFSFTTRAAQGLRSNKPPTFGIPPRLWIPCSAELRFTSDSLIASQRAKILAHID